jgi:RimJ/RimL family protein N-acetyltransferase
MLGAIDTLPGLYCKPQGKEISCIKKIPGGVISIRSLQIEKELPIIHQWVNLPYAQAYWQMAGPYEKLETIYSAIQENPHAHSFVGYLGEELVCQMDIYQVGIDELIDHLPGEDDQCGIHFLMAPLSRRVPGLSIQLFQLALHYYFSFPGSEKMFGEPDHQNQKANELVNCIGFQFLRTIELSYKKANLYVMEKQAFYSITGT